MNCLQDTQTLIGTLVGRTIFTLGPSPRPNRILAIQQGHVEIETEASTRKGTHPVVDIQWFADAWCVLQRDGYLDRSNLPDHVKRRSAAIVAVLARHDKVRVSSERVIRLNLRDS